MVPDSEYICDQGAANLVEAITTLALRDYKRLAKIYKGLSESNPIKKETFYKIKAIPKYFEGSNLFALYYNNINPTDLLHRINKMCGLEGTELDKIGVPQSDKE